MFLFFSRTIKDGFKDFKRNIWLSLSTISVLTVALFIINIQSAIWFANNLLLKEAKNRISISVYFQPTVSESDAQKVKDDLVTSIKKIQSIEFISSEEALKEFTKRNEDNEVLRKSIEELGNNPFGATLNIRAENPDDYAEIASAVENSRYKDLIESVNYGKYKELIDGLSEEINSNRKVGLILGVTLSVVAVLITFNNILVAMHARKQEIEIMRLVGASNGYIKMPFIWQGVFYGVMAAFITFPLVIFYLNFVANSGATNSILAFSEGVYLRAFLHDYLLAHWTIAIVAQILLGIFLGITGSLFAIRKQLKY